MVVTGLARIGLRMASWSCWTVCTRRLWDGATLLFAVTALKYLVTSCGVRLKVKSWSPMDRVISRRSLMGYGSFVAGLKSGC
ncbi:hypothetical protein D3C78_1716030 [compost metagenome]